MKIELLNIDGMSCAAEAFRLSREVTKEVEWQEIYTIDGPVTEMPSALLHFKNFTVVEREIIAASRTHVMWARTSFVDKPDKYELPKELIPYADPIVHLELKTKMREGKEKGLHQDEWRVYLPVMAQTCFTCRVSYRDMIKLAKYFFYLATHDKTCSVLRRRFGSVVEEMMSVVDKFTGSRDMTVTAMEGMTLAKFLHEGSVKTHDLISTDGFYLTTLSMPVWLRAHFVRHRPLLFTDDFFDAILANDDVMNLTIATPITMEIGATKMLWHALLGRRSCWLTQSTLSSTKDPWHAIIEQFLTEGPDILPCSDTHCSQSKDAMLRVEGRDPGCPCPRHLKINGIDPSQFTARVDQALKSRPKFWSDMWQEMTYERDPT